MRNLVIVMGRCQVNKKGFGIRFERKKANSWHATWSFQIKDSSAKREGYEKTRIEGDFIFDEGFPGCPHCETQNFCVCSCGKLFCMKNYSGKVTCPWCKATGEVSGQANSMQGGGDR
jgi:hypothetical protein